MKTGASGDSYILFSLGETIYALRTEHIRHLEMIDQITPVPNAAEDLEGVVFSRGQLVPVVNLRVRLGLERAPRNLRTRLLVVGTGDREVGLLVDSAREFVPIPAGSIHPPGSAISGASGKYLEGVATVNDRLVLVLKLAGLVEGPVEAARSTSESMGAGG